MRVLFPVGGGEGAGFFAAAVGLLAARDVTAALVVHVVDEARRAGLERGRERFLDRRALGPHRQAEIEEAEQEAAEEIVTRACTVLAGLLPVRPERTVLRGKTNEVLRDLAEEWEADLIVVRARSGRPGPHSIGKTARFLIDHAPKGALMVRDDAGHT
jgi:nucleotide-binding universal stress UspA family protein